jgi:hypothetical protein
VAPSVEVIAVAEVSETAQKIEPFFPILLQLRADGRVVWVHVVPVGDVAAIAEY